MLHIVLNFINNAVSCRQLPTAETSNECNMFMFYIYVCNERIFPLEFSILIVYYVLSTVLLNAEHDEFPRRHCLNLNNLLHDSRPLNTDLSIRWNYLNRHIPVGGRSISQYRFVHCLYIVLLYKDIINVLKYKKQADLMNSYQ